MPTCPDCAETVPAAASTCPHCGCALRGGPQRRPRSDGVACPRCGSQNLRSGSFPWYLGTVGALLMQALRCEDCGHEFDRRRPNEDLAKRKLRLAIIINGIGLIGIVAIIGALAAFAYALFSRH